MKLNLQQKPTARFSCAAIACALCLICQPISATELWCSGTVGNLFVDSSGNVLVLPTWRGDFIQVCNVNNPWNGVSVQTCFSWFSILKGANGKPTLTTTYYNGATATCNVLLTYGASPAPAYVMLQN